MFSLLEATTGRMSSLYQAARRVDGCRADAEKIASRLRMNPEFALVAEPSYQPKKCGV